MNESIILRSAESLALDLDDAYEEIKKLNDLLDHLEKATRMRPSNALDHMDKVFDQRTRQKRGKI